MRPLLPGPAGRQGMSRRFDLLRSTPCPGEHACPSAKCLRVLLYDITIRFLPRLSLGLMPTGIVFDLSDQCFCRRD